MGPRKRAGKDSPTVDKEVGSDSVAVRVLLVLVLNGSSGVISTLHIFFNSHVTPQGLTLFFFSTTFVRWKHITAVQYASARGGYVRFRTAPLKRSTDISIFVFTGCVFFTFSFAGACVRIEHPSTSTLRSLFPAHSPPPSLVTNSATPYNLAPPSPADTPAPAPAPSRAR